MPSQTRRIVRARIASSSTQGALFRASRALAQPLEPRRLFAAVNWDGGGDGTNWSDPNNWSNDLVPTNVDDVTINVAGTPTILLTGGQNVKTLSNSEILRIGSGVQAFTALSIATSLTNNGTLEIQALADGGYQSSIALGTNATAVNNGTIRTGAGISSSANLTGGGNATFTNAVGATIQVQSGTLNLNSLAFTQRGTIAPSAGATFRMSSGTLNYLGGSNAPGVILNSTTINLQAASSASAVIAEGSNTFAALASPLFTLQIGTPAVAYSTLDVPSNATNAGTIAFAPTLEGGYVGTMQIGQNATLTNNGTITANALTSSYNQINGNSIASSTLVNNGTINAQSRYLGINSLTLTQNGSITNSVGAQVIVNSSTLVYTGGSNGSDLRVRGSSLDLRAATTASTVIVDNGTNILINNLASNLTIDVRAENFGNSTLSVPANATNAGTILLNVLTPGGYAATVSINANVTLTNSGTIRATALASVSDQRRIQASGTGSTLVNNGTINVVEGDLGLDALTFRQNGVITIASGAAVKQSNGSLIYLGGRNDNGFSTFAVSLDLRAASAASNVVIHGTCPFIGNTATNLTVVLRSDDVFGGETLLMNTAATNAGIILFDSQSNAGYGDVISFSDGGTLNNTGTIRVAAGVPANAQRQIACNDTSAAKLINNGTINLLGGDINFYGFTLEQRGAITFANGALFKIQSGRLDYLGGSNGNGLLITGGDLNIVTVAAASTIDVRSNPRLLANGSANMTLSVKGDNVYGYATVTVPQNATNAGTILLEGNVNGYAGVLSLADNTTFTNTGTIRGVASGVIPAYQAINGSTGEFRAKFVNAGTLDATNGPLSVYSVDMTQQGVIHTAGSNRCIVSNGNLLYLTGSNDPGVYVQYTTLDLRAATAASTLNVLTSATLVKSLSPLITIRVGSDPAEGFGELSVSGSVVNAATIDLHPTIAGYNPSLRILNTATLANNGFGVVKTSGLVGGGAMITIDSTPEATGIFTNNSLISLTGGINVNGFGTINNNGTIATTGSGETIYTGFLANHGQVNVATGTTLRLVGGTNVDSGAFLSGGHYAVATGARLSFYYDANSSAAINTADIEVSGSGILEFKNLNDNRGRIALLDGASLSITPTDGSFALEGILDLAPGTVFTVNGNMTLSGTSQPIIRTEISSATSFGKVAITGSLNLNSPDSTSRLDPDLVGGYNPAIGSLHRVIVANGGITNSFDAFFGGATPGGNTLTAVRPDANTVAISVSTGAPPPAPKILSQTYEYETRQAIVFQFDQDVSAFLSRKDYKIINTTTGQTLPQSAGTLTFNTASNQATLLLTNQLADGNYTLTVQASDIANAAGVPLTSGQTLPFFVMRGDFNRDRHVNFDDLIPLAQNYNKLGRTFSQGNADYSVGGEVNFDDLIILAQRYNSVLAMPAATINAVVTGKSKPRSISDGVLA